ncbi:MAG: NepR family anti-sigma factor [Methylocystis sp.]|uniref:NepR family anti-sigma factor n=1 Tax=Methylocystis sp. TaxID=1911079 RepID=UPI003D0C7588
MRRSSVHHQKVGDQVGDLLRRTYDDVLREPLPDRLRDLIKKLESDRSLFFGDAQTNENSEPSLALEER